MPATRPTACSTCCSKKRAADRKNWLESKGDLAEVLA